MRWLQWTLVGLLFGMLLGCGQAEVTPDAPEAVSRKVMVTNAGENRVEAVKALRAATGLGLAEAEQLLDSIPSVVATGLSHDEADRISRALMAAGMTTQVSRD